VSNAELSKDEWITRCAAKYKSSGLCTDEDAVLFAEACYSYRDDDLSPEAHADEDMSYWSDDAD
jgi:hypothetical protein